MGKGKRTRAVRRDHAEGRGTWWIAGISMPLEDGTVGIVPPVLGLTHDDQDRAIVRATIAATHWARAVGLDPDTVLPGLRVQALPVRHQDVPTIREDLVLLAEQHDNEDARRAARVALGDDAEAEAVPVPDCIRQLKSNRDAGCRPAQMVTVRLEKDTAPAGTTH